MKHFFKGHSEVDRAVHASGQCVLGWRLANGAGVAKDEVEAVKWYRKAAEKGNAEAQFSLGVMLAEGRVVAKDEVGAVNCFAKGVGDVERGGLQTPLRVGERGQGEEAERGGFFAEGAGGAVRLNGYASPFEPVHQRKAQGVGQVGGEDDDLSGRDAFFVDEALDFGGEPVEELGIEAEGRIVNGE